MEFDITQTKTPSIPRRLGAMLYDTVLLLGILLVANALYFIPYQILIGHPIEAGLPRLLQQLYLLAVIAGFYVYFWTHGGQTLGMRAWRLRVIDEDGKALDTGAALTRFGWSIPSILGAGMGLWWSLIDREGLAWHDRKSRSRLVMMEKSA